MLLSAIAPQTPFSNLGSSATNLLFSSTKSHSSTTSLKPLLPNINATTSSSSPIAANNTSLQNPSSLRHVTSIVSDDEQEGGDMVSSASAVASAIRCSSTSQVEFVQMVENVQGSKLVLPSADFQRLCVQLLDLFRRIVDPDAILSVYVRPAGSYVMDRLELRRVTCYPGGSAADIVILVGNFHIPTGLRAAEAALSSQQVEFVPELRSAVFPMVKHPFVVGFLVAELPYLEVETSSGHVHTEGRDLIQLPAPERVYGLPSGSSKKSLEIQTSNDDLLRMYNFTNEQISNAINISQSLAMAYVMDQKAMLLQQSSWQNNVRMSNLVEQIRGPLSSIRTLSKMLSTHMKRNEIAYDIVEDILVQGDRMKDTLQELQDAVYLTKANIMRYNEETLKKLNNSSYAHPESVTSQLSNNFSRELQNSGRPLSRNTASNDLEMPMPPLALWPLQQNEIRPCNVCEVLSDLVEAVRPLTHRQQRTVELNVLSHSLQVAIEEPALRQALSNLIEGALLRTHVGGKVEIVSTGAPAGGALVVIDDDGPDMHYMTQMHSLTPFGMELLSENMVEDSMTWNFVAGLTVAREILESYGCVVRVISPRSMDAAVGAGGTRIELWLPSFAGLSDLKDFASEA